jgi:hypothetical protein
LGLIIPLPRTGCDIPRRLPILSPPIGVDGAREVILAFAAEHGSHFLVFRCYAANYQPATSRFPAEILGVRCSCDPKNSHRADCSFAVPRCF